MFMMETKVPNFKGNQETRNSTILSLNLVYMHI